MNGSRLSLYGYPVISTSFVKKTILCPILFWHSCVRPLLHIKFGSINPSALMVPIRKCFHYCSFIVSPQTRKGSPLSLFFLFTLFWLFQVLWPFLSVLEWDSPFLFNILLVRWFWLLRLYNFRGEVGLLLLLSLLFHEHNTSLH